MNKLFFVFLTLTISKNLFAQKDTCWDITEERKQIFINYLADKGGDFEVYLKATTINNYGDTSIYFIKKYIYVNYLLNSNLITRKSLIDTLKSRITRGITLTDKETSYFESCKVNRTVYDSLRLKPLTELLNNFFSKDAGNIFTKYYHVYSHPLALILYDYYIVFSYGPNGIAPRFYIDLLRSGCFK